VEKAKDPSTINDFMKWVEYHAKDYLTSANVNEIDEHDDKYHEHADDILDQIAADLRSQVPLEAQLESENIVFPTTGQNSDCDPQTTVHVDAFLYDDKLVDDLCDEGKLPKNYCLSCGSRNSKPLTFISHSASRENLGYIFRTLLPDLKGKHVLDIGSRFGAVLYGAALHSRASKITGVELNADWVAISSAIIQKYNLQSRVEVLGGDVRLHPQLVSAADVVILNNVFEFFAPPEVQRQLWLILRRLIKPGTLVLTCPSLEDSLSHLNTDIDLQQWVQQIENKENMGDSDADSAVLDLDLVNLYRVL